MTPQGVTDRTRRTVLKQLSLVAAGALGRSWPAAHAEPARQSADAGNGPPTMPVKTRLPLAPSEFLLLPLGSIQPTGWLRAQLQIQADGLGGHLDEVWPDVGPNSGWLGGTGESWERGPYFVDGLLPLAYALNDQRLKEKAQRFIEWTLQSQRSDGMFGPHKQNDWWPRMVMLKALTQYQEATADKRVIPALSRYFAYQSREMTTRPLQSWGRYRWQDEVLSVLWLYNRSGDASLLPLARLLKAQGYDWQAQFADFQFTVPCTAAYLGLQPGGNNEKAMQSHGVNNAMALKASPVWYLVSGSKTDRAAMYRQLEALDRYHGLPNGIFSADEHLAGRDPVHGTELCTVVEAMFSLEQSIAILGDARLCDRLEKIAYNALPGAFTDDMWAHQYNQQPNQVEVSVHSKPWTTDGPESNIYGLEPNFGCCTANFHQGWPKLTSSTWMMSQDDGLVAVLYAPVELRTTIRGVDVHVVEETSYPFQGAVRFRISPSQEVNFPLRLRIPEWANAATIKVNGKAVPATDAGTFTRIDRRWVAGDVVELSLPLAPRVSVGYRETATIERGSLVFALDIEGDWVKLRNRGLANDWQVYPSKPWNYALEFDGKNAASEIEVTENKVGAMPFAAKDAPVVLTVRGRKVPTWRAEDSIADPLPASPVKTEERQEQLSLIPYAAAKLRITAFPQVAKPHGAEYARTDCDQSEEGIRLV